MTHWPETGYPGHIQIDIRCDFTNTMLLLDIIYINAVSSNYSLNILLYNMCARLYYPVGSPMPLHASAARVGLLQSKPSRPTAADRPFTTVLKGGSICRDQTRQWTDKGGTEPGNRSRQPGKRPIVGLAASGRRASSGQATDVRRQGYGHGAQPQPCPPQESTPTARSEVFSRCPAPRCRGNVTRRGRGSRRIHADDGKNNKLNEV